MENFLLNVNLLCTLQGQWHVYAAIVLALPATLLEKHQSQYESLAEQKRRAAERDNQK